MIHLANRASALIYWFVKSYPGKYLLPVNICPIVPITLKKAFVPFDFIDIDPTTLCADESKVMERIASEKEIRGLIFVRTYGYVYDTAPFFRQLKSTFQDFKIIDDKCLCFPDFLPISDDVDMELFSTGYAKPVDLGYAGYAKLSKNCSLTHTHEKYDPESLIKLEKAYRICLQNRTCFDFPESNWLDTGVPAISFDTYQQTVAEKLDKVSAHKSHLNEIYRRHFGHEIALITEFHNWRFNIMVDKKKKKVVLQNLFKAGLFASSHYIPSNRLFDKQFFDHAEKLSDCVINLFNDFYYTAEQAEKTCKIIRRHL